MMGRLLGAGRVAEVFEYGDAVIKLYRPGIGPEQARHEAMVLDALRETPLRVPSNLGVVEIDARWGLKMSRMPGTVLGSRMDPANLPAALKTFTRLHRLVLDCEVEGLPVLKIRLSERIGRASLPAPLREKVLAHLARLPDGDRLCHGDFHPFNIMVERDEAGIIDWVDATRGPPAADVARTYLLIALHQADAAERYLEAMVDGREMRREFVTPWLPVVATARLAENVEGETDRLLAWARLA